MSPFSLIEYPPKRNRTWNGDIGKFFNGEIKNRSIDTSKYDILAFVYFHDQSLSHREYNGFLSYIGGSNTVYVCASTYSVSSDDGVQGVAHELTHIFGVSDKYNYPLEENESCCDIPEGIPEPDKVPLFPQEKACLMCEGILLSERSVQAPGNLDKVVICTKTAEELGWIDID